MNKILGSSEEEKAPEVEEVKQVTTFKIIDDKPEYSLEFPKREKKGKKKMKSRWE